MKNNHLIVDNIWATISWCFILFLIPFLIMKGGVFHIIINAASMGFLLPIFWIYIFMCAIYFCIGKNYLVKLQNAKMVSICIFILSVIPRLFIFFNNEYIPTNDFYNYFLYGQYAYQHDFESIASIVSSYQLPKMGGLAVFNGLIAVFFSPTLIGFQIANVIITSLIAVLLYQLIRKLNNKIAILSAFLFILYPSNIISSQITTNVHSAIMFFLLAILYVQKALDNNSKRKYVFCAIVSGLFLAISDFIHCSAILVLLAISCYIILLIFKQNSNKTKSVVIAITIFVCYYLSTTFGLIILNNMGIINDYKEVSMLVKIVIGLNNETMGTFSQSDYDHILSLSENDQSTECIVLIRERLHDPETVVKLLLNKIYYTWMSGDNHFWFYFEGQENNFNEMIQSGQITAQQQNEYNKMQAYEVGLSNLDIIYVQLLYWLSMVGIFKNRKCLPTSASGILTFVALGWICFLIISEVQSRYRYFAIPSFTVLAAIGIYVIRQYLDKLLILIRGKVRG